MGRAQTLLSRSLGEPVEGHQPSTSHCPMLALVFFFLHFEGKLKNNHSYKSKSNNMNVFLECPSIHISNLPRILCHMCPWSHSLSVYRCKYSLLNQFGKLALLSYYIPERMQFMVSLLAIKSMGNLNAGALASPWDRRRTGGIM